MGASHKILWPRFVAAYRRQKAAPNPELDQVGGSVNYKSMGWLGALLHAWLGWPAEAVARCRDRALGFLLEQRQVGHLALEGPRGVQNEQGCPDPHWKFNLAPILAVWKEALARGDRELAGECETSVAGELALCQRLHVNGKTLMPGGRVKDQKGQAYSDPRDTCLSLVLQQPAPVNRPPKAVWWRNDDGIGPSILRELLARPGEGEALRQRLLAAEVPKLLLPIYRASLPDGGYLAWVEDTPEARTQLGQDGLAWVLRMPGREDLLGYDWAPLPEIPEECTVEVLGRVA